MTYPPIVPMTPDGRPQQRLNLVVELPPIPPQLEITVGFGIFPERRMERRPWPRLPTYLLQIEFAQTPMNCGVSGFYIEARRTYWMLWERYLVDDGYRQSWCWQASGYCLRRGVDERTAAVGLMTAFWTMANETPDDDDYWINETGLLSMEEIRAISREVRSRTAR